MRELRRRVSFESFFCHKQGLRDPLYPILVKILPCQKGRSARSPRLKP